MKVAKIVEEKLKNLRYGKVYDYSIFDDIKNRNALYVALNRLSKAKKIKRFSKGKFYKTKVLEAEIGNDQQYKYQSSVDNSSKWEVILGEGGVVTGPALYNAKSLTTQNPFIVEVSRYGTRKKRTKIAGENIQYKPLPMIATKENRKIIEFIDILANKKRIQDINMSAYKQYIQTTLKSINIKELAKILNYYDLRVKKELLSELSIVNPSLARFLETQTLKPYQRGVFA
jgi:hypothetical protein